jgi:membrane-bound lytic murein transglycosylase MltF
VAFTRPTWKNVRELVVSGPAAPGIESLDDLAATGLHLRPSSSYFEHVSTLNQARDAAGKPVIPVESMDEYLEDYDLLEMVQAGILPAIIVDSHKAAILARVFDNITVHEDLSVNEGGEIAWAVRKDNPKLLSALNGFVGQVRKGSLLGNILIKRYLGDQDWIDNVQSEDALGRYKESLGLIQKYAGQYEFDWLMIVAQGFQESKLDQSKRSKAGAIGIMQVMPATANDRVVGIPDIENAESNVHAGVKYLRFLRKRYFDGTEIAPLDRVLFAFAAYNAGPGGIGKARKRASKMGLDPNRWFDNVEIAAAHAISREPVIYVRNIYKYYIAYKLLENSRGTGKEARSAPGGG